MTVHKVIARFLKLKREELSRWWTDTGKIAELEESITRII